MRFQPGEGSVITNLQMDLRLNLYGCPAQHQTLAFFVLRHSNTALAASLGWARRGTCFSLVSTFAL